MAFPRATAGLTACLAITQILGWAMTFSSVSVLARPISETLHLSLALVLAGPSVFLIAMAVSSPVIAPAYGRFGAGPIMIAGSVLLAGALGVLSVANSLITYMAAWALIGIAGAACLATSANTLLAEHAGRGARRLITAVMLVSGLASSLGAPLSAALNDLIGWQWTCMLYAGVELLICVPVNVMAARLARKPAALAVDAEVMPIKRRPVHEGRGLFPILAVALSLTGCVTWGFSVIIVELLRAIGLDAVRAVELATLAGFAQLAARFAEFQFARNSEASKTAILAGCLFPFSLVALAVWPSFAGALAFVVLFGLASGIMSVARATIPLELFDPVHYGALTSRLALPMNLAFAAAPFGFGYALDHGGPQAALLSAGLAALVALAALVLVRRMAYGVAEAS